MTLKIEFTLSDNCDIGYFDDFCRGHLTITGRQASITSLGRHPDQSMMIVLSLVELLDGIRRFLRGELGCVYQFVGVDSSFEFQVAKTTFDTVEVKSYRGIIDEVSTSELVLAVLNGTTQFLTRYGQWIGQGEIASEDLQNAIQSFKEEFFGRQ